MANAKQANWDFKFKDIDGKEVELASFKGKVVLLNFWATWCGPCKAEIPGFVELQEKYRDKLTIIGYSVDDTAELAKKYAAQYKMNYPILLGEGREDVQDAYGPIWGIPASFIISKDGEVCRKHMGIAPKAVFEKEIVALTELAASCAGWRGSLRRPCSMINHHVERLRTRSSRLRLPPRVSRRLVGQPGARRARGQVDGLHEPASRVRPAALRLSRSAASVDAPRPA